MITLDHYYIGRDVGYDEDLTDEIRANAVVTLERVNRLLERAQADGVTLDHSPRTGSLVSSGWRPPSVNASIKGAAVRSKHMTGQACDVYDPDGDLDAWCLDNQDVLVECELWLEHPSATKGWCHLQTVGPRSGRRVFYP